MIAYWFMYLLPAFATLAYQRNTAKSRDVLALVGIIYVLFIGLRYQVGGDWYNYLHHYDLTLRVPFAEAIETTDPGYAFLNWVMGLWGLGIYGVNLVSGAFFIAGLVIFARRQPLPWLAFTLAIPYLLVVMAMGYTRQAVALGFVFWALAALEDGKFKHYLLLVGAAALFHKSAVLMMPFGMFMHSKHKYVRIIAVVLAALVLWRLLLEEQATALWTNYVEADMESGGAATRVAMNAVPALLLLLVWPRWKKLYPNSGVWFWMAVLSLVAAALVGYASTAVDRVALYFSAIQLVVYSRIPFLIRDPEHRGYVVIAILLLYGAVMGVWLNFGTHAPYWLPYRNALFL